MTYGAIVGVLTAAVAIGVGQLVSGLTVSQGAPWAVVGEAAINLAPPPVKNFAIATFGSNDKNVLVTGILILLAVFAAFVGVAALRHLALGYWGLAIFAAVGVAAAVSLPKANAGWAAPTVIGALAAAVALSRLTRLALAATEVAPLPYSAPPGRSGPANFSGPPRSAASPGSLAPSRPVDSSDSTDPSEPATPLASPDTEESDDTGDSHGPPPETWTYRPPTGPARRRFLVASGLAVGATAITALAGRELNARQSVTQARSTIRLPRAAEPAPPLPAGVDLKIPDLSSFITPNSSFYRVDTAIVLPQVDPKTWTLRIHGLVDREVSITFDQLLRRPLIEHYLTMTCVSDPVSGPYIGNAKWLGASLADLIRSARPRAGASQLLCTSTDGFTSGTPIEVVLDGREALLAVGMNGTPLPVQHGFPARMVVPGLYGYVSGTKWVTDIKVTTYQAETAYWAQRGWSPQAPIKTECRIDVPLGGASRKPGRTAVAGVAWAQHRGISAVEVRVDSGPWHQATLATVPGIDTWRQWVWYWDATPGHHIIEARATDGTGHTQTAAPAPPEPNGATGYPTTTLTISS
ncbi:MAG TPA: molybdopterin-dependent oxidoreductase [Streptosporangiaceae bacterium]